MGARGLSIAWIFSLLGTAACAAGERLGLPYEGAPGSEEDPAVVVGYPVGAGGSGGGSSAAGTSGAGGSGAGSGASGAGVSGSSGVAAGGADDGGGLAESGMWPDADAGDAGVALDADGGTAAPDGSPVGGAEPSVLAGGGFHTCAVRGGAVACWGMNSEGQLGTGSTSGAVKTPVTAQGITDAIAVSAGSRFTCAVLASGSVSCWGQNGFGQLGRGSAGGNQPTPAPVSGSGDAEQVTAGDDFACALRATGAVECWGWNDFGQIGDGSTTRRDAPVAVSGLGSVAAVRAGAKHACAALQDGTVRCWGRNDWGQLGSGSTSSRSPTPVAVVGVSDAVDIAVGGDAACAVHSTGALSCWGYNVWGQLGTGGTSVANATPKVVADISDAARASVGGKHVCALHAGGSVSCWGWNDFGQVGDGSTSQRKSPVAVPSMGGALGVAAASGDHSCALVGTGVSCWGYNVFGQLGTGSTSARETTPTAVVGLP